VEVSFDGGVAPAGSVAAAAEPPPDEPPAEAAVVGTPEDGLPAGEDGDEARSGIEGSEAVPEWAGSAPSVGLVAGLKGASGRSRRNLLLAAGGVGVLVLAAVGMAIFAGGGKKRSASDQGRSQVRSVVEVSKAAASAQPAAGAKPALPAAAVEPAKPQPPAEEKPQAGTETKPAAAEKIAVPAERPAHPEKPAPAPTPAAEATKPTEKGVAAEKPVPAQHPAAQKPAGVPKPAAERPVADKAKPSSEPALARPEKKQGPAAMSGAKPDSDKALWATQAYQRGNAKLLGGAPTEAIAAFSEALRLNPKDAQSRRGLGLAYAQSGNAGQAVHHLKLYLKASPNAPDRALIQKRIDQLGGH
jgi:ribosomal protein S15P/S13E